MDSRIYQTNLGKIGRYDFSERNIVLALPAPTTSLPYNKDQNITESENYAVALKGPKHPIHIYLPQSEKLLNRSLPGNGPYLAYHRAQMLEDQETWHFVDIRV